MMGEMGDRTTRQEKTQQRREGKQTKMKTMRKRAMKMGRGKQSSDQRRNGQEDRQ